MIILIFFTIIFLLILISYISLLLKFHNLKLPKLFIDSKNILFIYAHPDDEIFTSLGLMKDLNSRTNTKVFSVSVTKGEKGKELFPNVTDQELAQIRALEYKQVMRIANIQNYEIWDFNDSQLEEQSVELKNKIDDFLSKNNIDTVITFEKTGMYGHKDHMALSAIINELGKHNSDIKVLFSTMPAKLENFFDMKSQMKGIQLNKVSFAEQPKFKHYSWKNIIVKLKAIRIYKSQKLGHKFPAQVKLLFAPIEYYTDEY